MNGTRIEIFKNNKWNRLVLDSDRDIKYNVLVNKVGSISTREISHSNTFSLPNILHNRQVLDLNIFNKSTLATSLNSKYRAKYYIQDRLLRVGFLVINNTRNNQINVNFIDEALGLVEKWKEVTFFDLFFSGDYTFSAEYEAAIAELKNFSISKSAIVTPVPDIGTKNYPIVSFPNNLNTIGDKFQVDSFDGRDVDTFNPYQSRPLFNAKAFIELICEAFDYTLNVDSTIDVAKLERTYIVPEKTGEGFSLVTNIVSEETSPGLALTSATQSENDNWTVSGVAVSSTNSRKPSEFPNWTHISNLGSGYEDLDCVIVPQIAEGYDGEIIIEGDVSLAEDIDFELGVFRRQTGDLFTIWQGQNPGDNFVYERVEGYFRNAQDYQKIKIELDKSKLETPPTGAGDLVGIVFVFQEFFNSPQPSDAINIRNSKITETSLKNTGLSFSKRGEFISEEVDLTLFAPRVSLQKLLSGILQKEGILIDINVESKEVNFFSYQTYENNKASNNSTNWSDFLLRYDDYNLNTDYGRGFGKNNQIGLKSPFAGNIFNKKLTNFDEDSKYESSVQHDNSIYKDVSEVSYIVNTTPYLEYKNLGIGLVEKVGNHAESLKQIGADRTSAGSFSNLAKMGNVNFASISASLDSWYKLVDNSIRAEPTFLVPIQDMKNLDIKKPVYINELGGYYIIEEVLEYINNEIPVKIKLIKL